MPEIAHTWYSYPMESMMAVAAKDADKYRCWRDFSGKPVFYTNAGFMNWLNWQRIYKALGYEFKRPDRPQVERRRDAVRHDRRLRHLHHGRPLARVLLEGDRDPDGHQGGESCPDEIAKIQAAGLAVVDVDPKGAFSKDVGPSTLKGVPILFGYNVGTNIPEDVVYKMLNAFYKNKDDLAKSEPGLYRWRRISPACRRRESTPIRTFRYTRPGQVPEGAQGLEQQVEGRKISA